MTDVALEYVFYSSPILSSRSRSLSLSLSLSSSVSHSIFVSVYLSFHHQDYHLRSLSITYGSRSYYHRIVVATPAAAADRPVSSWLSVFALDPLQLGGLLL